MLSLISTLFRLLHALWVALKDPEFRNLFAILSIFIISGTIFYTQVEGWRFLDAFYFTVITISTVGYGDFAPQTEIGKIFTIALIFVGIGLFVAVASELAGSMSARRKNRKRKAGQRSP